MRHYADDAQQRRDPKYIDRLPDGRRVDGVLYPRAGRARRLHRAQRDDPRLSAQLGLGSARRPDRRRLVARRRHARATSSGSRTAGTAGSSASRRGSAGTRAGTAGRAGCTTEKAMPEAAFRDRDLRRTILGSAKARLGGTGGADRSRPVGEPGRPERLARRVRGRRRHPLHAADDRTATSASASASGCWTCAQRYPGSAGHQDATRSSPGSCSTARARSASSIATARGMYRAHPSPARRPPTAQMPAPRAR